MRTQYEIVARESTGELRAFDGHLYSSFDAAEEALEDYIYNSTPEDGIARCFVLEIREARHGR